MKISVVTPTHNKVGLLRRTLDSLAAQDFDPARFEAVVVDDRSEDGTPSFLASYRPPYALRTVRIDERGGRAAARNRGVERAEGDLVVFLDDDMELLPGFLAAHAALHEKNEKAAGVGNVRNHPDISVAPIDRYMSTRGAQKIRDRGPLPWKYFSTNNSSVRREHFERVRGFDENFVHYGFEDMELALRLEEEMGVVVLFVEGARSLHRHAHSLDELLEKKALAGRHSLAYLFRKHPRAKKDLRYDRFDPPRPGDPWLLNGKRLFYRTILSEPVCRLVKPLARVPLGPITDKAIDLLVQYEYLRGLAEAGEQER